MDPSLGGASEWYEIAEQAGNVQLLGGGKRASTRRSRLKTVRKFHLLAGHSLRCRLWNGHASRTTLVRDGQSCATDRERSFEKTHHVEEMAGG